jgi:NADPH-dependent glutamate synthase beta subunit-like oxidoreductase/NAD-dependent dihydropyrimidine dehydrogenase PreA subunit
MLDALTNRGGVPMGYRIGIDQSNCINCGICMDVCPVEALDMSRPTRPGIESGLGEGAALPWMMEHPTQVGECIGCSICIRECPVVVMTLYQDAGTVPLSPRQGPVRRPVEVHGWLPLSQVTTESLKPEHVSPWGDLFDWRTAERPKAWQTWRSMVAADPASPQEPAASGPAENPKAPCQVACPAGTDAGRYVGLIAEGRFDDAYAVAAEVNPFPSVCGWICTAPCEAACRRGVLDEPISIRTLKRFAAEKGHLPPVPAATTKRSERVAIVGGGPAGMAAAYYLARLGYPVTVFEAMPVPGGMMAIGIPEYRLPREVIREEVERIVGLGVELHLDTAMGRDFSLGDLEQRGYKAVFLATGASKSRRLGVDGEGLSGVVPATLFLKRVNLGEPAALSGHVVVVGGGSTAMDAARSAWRSGAEKVTIAYRRGRDEMPAQHEEVEAAEREGIVIRTGIVPTRVVGRDGATVALRCQEQRPTSAVAGGRAVWEPVPGSEVELPATTVLVAVGEEPDPSILPEGAGIEVSGWAGIVADPRTHATGRAGIFAGGDVVSGPKTIIDAVASGRRAAGSIHEYLSGARDGEAEIFAAVRYATPPEPSLTLRLEPTPRAHPPLPVVQAGFRANQAGFDEATARAEASRCFRCDAVYGCPSVHVASGRGPADRPGVPGARLPGPPPDVQLPVNPTMSAGNGGAG